MPGIRTRIGFFLIVAVGSRLAAAPPALVEVQTGQETLQGKVVAHDERLFWLLAQDGRLRALSADGVKKFRQISPQFSGASSSVLRDSLRREFGRDFDVVGTRHFAVCSKGEQKARVYAEAFEDLFRSFQMYFSVRGFTITEPEFPLVAIVFPDYDSFSKYARNEKVATSRNLRGYYLPTSNRIALYESADADQQAQRAEDASLQNQLHLDAEMWGAFEGSLKDTLIHEATHQVAFNTGLHSRIGPNPKWVVEGLATVFESPGIRNPGSASIKTRINRERYMWFGDYSKSRRKPKSLEAFLTGDELFQSSALDAYSEAWAFSFFLIETRPRAYAEYLRLIAARDPLGAYGPDQRLADFKKAVSSDLPVLEAEFLRFMASIR